jgi:hypothetical protein
LSSSIIQRRFVPTNDLKVSTDTIVEWIPHRISGLIGGMQSSSHKSPLISMKTVSGFIPQAVRALLLAMLLSWPALLNAADLSQPHILVATPELRDSIFRSTVLVVAAMGGDQHLGVIVNRPAGVTLGKILPEHGPSQKITDPVHFGGPVGAEWIFALVHR